MGWKTSCMKQTHLYRCSFECLLQDFMGHNKMIYYGRKMLLSFALTPRCPPLLQPNPIYRPWTRLLISSCHSLLLSRSLSIFFLPPIWHFSASLFPPSFSPYRLQLCSLHASLASILFPSFLSSLPASLSKPTTAWPISMMTSSTILSRANNDSRNPVSLRGWISPERANRKINRCLWGLQKMVCQQTMMTVF